MRTHIPFESYEAFLAPLKHLFLVGDLRNPVAHPFFRDPRIEMILCTYEDGDDGEFHWHREVTEYEIILEGRVGYQHASTGHIEWHLKGDLSLVPEGECVKRLVPVVSRTLAIKVPSRPDDKVHCHACSRVCQFRKP